MAPKDVTSPKPLLLPMRLLVFVYSPITAVWYWLSWMNGVIALPTFVLKILPHPFVTLSLWWWTIPLILVMKLWEARHGTNSSEKRSGAGVGVGPTMTRMLYAYTPILGAVAWLSLLKEMMVEPGSILQHLPDPFTAFATTYIIFPLFFVTLQWDNYTPTLGQLDTRYSPATARRLLSLCNAVVYVYMPIVGILWWLAFVRDKLPIGIQDMTPTLGTATLMASTFGLYHISYDGWIREKVAVAEQPDNKSLEAGETATNLVKLQGNDENDVVSTNDSAAG